MGDIFVEQIVKKQTGAVQKCILSILSVLAAVIFCAGFFFNRYIICALGIIIAVVAYFYKRNTDIEYEYCLVNTQLDIDKVIANSSRKALLSVDLKNIEIVAPVGSGRLARLNDLKTFDFTSGVSGIQTFVLVVRAENEAMKIIFNPNNKLMDAIYKMAPGKVFAD